MEYKFNYFNWLLYSTFMVSVTLDELKHGITWMSCRLVSSVTEGLAIEKQVPSHGNSRVLRVSTPA